MIMIPSFVPNSEMWSQIKEYNSHKIKKRTHIPKMNLKFKIAIMLIKTISYFFLPWFTIKICFCFAKRFLFLIKMILLLGTWNVLSKKNRTFILACAKNELYFCDKQCRSEDNFTFKFTFSNFLSVVIFILPFVIKFIHYDWTMFNVINEFSILPLTAFPQNLKFLKLFKKNKQKIKLITLNPRFLSKLYIHIAFGSYSKVELQSIGEDMGGYRKPNLHSIILVLVWLVWAHLGFYVGCYSELKLTKPILILLSED